METQHGLGCSPKPKVKAGMKYFLRAAFLAILLSPAGTPALANDPSIIPLTLAQGEYGGGRIYLPVRFGNVTGTMRLDTGASTSRITLAPWNKDLPVVRQSESTGASGRATQCDDVEAKNVEIKASQGNGVARAKYEVTRCPVSGGDDLLGLDFFRGARFTLDFDRREMIFFDKPRSDPPPAPVRPLGPEQRLAGIPLRAGNVPTVGLFDTGAEMTAADLRFVEKHRRLFAPVKSRLKASEAGGGKFSSKIYRIKELNLGDGRIVKDVYALVYDFGLLREALGPQAPLMLGYNFLSRFNWEIDLTNPASPSWSARLRK